MKLPAHLQNKDLQEYYGPMDGVLPENHIDQPHGIPNGDYLAINYSVCLTAPTHDEIYIEQNRHRRRLCRTCYHSYRPADFSLLITNHIVHHRGNYNPNQKLYCYRCFKQVFWENGRGSRCSDCIEQMMDTALNRFIQSEQVVIRKY